MGAQPRSAARQVAVTFASKEDRISKQEPYRRIYGRMLTPVDVMVQSLTLKRADTVLGTDHTSS